MLCIRSFFFCACVCFEDKIIMLLVLIMKILIIIIKFEIKSILIKNTYFKVRFVTQNMCQTSYEKIVNNLKMCDNNISSFKY